MDGEIENLRALFQAAYPKLDPCDIATEVLFTAWSAGYTAWSAGYRAIAQLSILEAETKTALWHLREAQRHWLAIDTPTSAIAYAETIRMALYHEPLWDTNDAAVVGLYEAIETLDKRITHA